MQLHEVHHGEIVFVRERENRVDVQAGYESAAKRHHANVARHYRHGRERGGYGDIEDRKQRQQISFELGAAQQAYHREIGGGENERDTPGPVREYFVATPGQDDSNGTDPTEIVDKEKIKPPKNRQRRVHRMQHVGNVVVFETAVSERRSGGAPQ